MPKQKQFYVVTKPIAVNQDGFEYEIPEGQIVARFHGNTYGCIDNSVEVPISMLDKDGDEVFVGMPIDSLQESTI